MYNMTETFTEISEWTKHFTTRDGALTIEGRIWFNDQIATPRLRLDNIEVEGIPFGIAIIAAGPESYEELCYSTFGHIDQVEFSAAVERLLRRLVFSADVEYTTPIE